MFVTDPGIYRRSGNKLHDWWRSELRQTGQVGRHYAGYGRTDALFVRSAQSRRLDTLRGPGWVAIGDAAMTFDPLSSLGIAKAVDQGGAMAAVLGRHLNSSAPVLDEYVDDLSARYAQYLATRTGYYRLEQRWSDAEFWQSRQQCAA
jgi:flavin-dependent dehydrogenase